ncbi:MAG: DNA adenine methylase [Rhodobiaceae bacterium]|nr:DNA adenine methylase [Rhodobiaceae bacterium]MCC0019198.1 DNA adenine methylase [Rhodobiaceae bacterium]
MREYPLDPVDPVRPAAGYIGGKKNLIKRLLPRIEAVEHVTYAEPFVGMGGVFLRRRSRPKSEVINDRSGDVATFFRILQRHYTPFMEMLRYQITSRREFERLALEDVRTLTDLERAARFLYLQRTAFGGKVAGRTFGVDVTGGGRFNVTSLAPALEDLHERLAGVIIENLDWAEFIPRYDRPGTLFYLDPPYWGCETDYGPGFERGDFARLADLLSGLQGRFILSLNDVPEVRELFAWAKIDAIETTYTIGQNKGKKAGELVISTP